MAGVNFEVFRQPCDSDINPSHILWLSLKLLVNGVPPQIRNAAKWLRTG